MRPKPVAVLGLSGALIAAPAFAIQLNVGDILIADDPLGSSMPSRILRFDATTGAHEVIASGGAMTFINSIELDRHGRILVVDSFAGIIRINPATGEQQVLSGNFFDEGYQFPRDVLETPSGDLLVTTSNRHVLRIDRHTGAKSVLAQFSVPIEDISYLGDDILATSPSFPEAALLRVDPTTWTHMVISSGGFFDAPNDLAVTDDGYAFVADVGGILVGIDPATGVQTSASAGGPLTLLSAVTIGGNGRPIVSTWAGQVFEIDPDNFGEQILLTAPGEDLGRLVALHYVAAIPSPASVAAFGAAGLGLLVRRRRGERSPGTARRASNLPERACRSPRAGERAEGVRA